jgi:hypothetical protein
MAKVTTSKVNRLLRVLVVGGVALAGTAGVRADDKPADPKATKAAEETKGKEKGEKKAAGKEAAGKEAAGKETAAKEKPKEKTEEGGGVKGW